MAGYRCLSKGVILQTVSLGTMQLKPCLDVRIMLELKRDGLIIQKGIIVFIISPHGPHVSAFPTAATPCYSDEIICRSTLVTG